MDFKSFKKGFAIVIQGTLISLYFVGYWMGPWEQFINRIHVESLESQRKKLCFYSFKWQWKEFNGKGCYCLFSLYLIIKKKPWFSLYTSASLGLPFMLSRKQFPVRISFAITINKSHGQTIPNVGIYLPRHVFSHGQLYVVLSR